MPSDKTWVVRAGRGGEIIQTFEARGIVAIGWVEMEDCSSLKTRDDFRSAHMQAYPNSRSPGGQSGQVYRFVREMQVGDTVLSPDPSSREVLVGEVTGEYRYDPTPTDGAYPQVRDVKWRGRMPRDKMKPQFRSSVGGQATIFTVEGYGDEIKAILAGDVPPTGGPEKEEEDTFDFLADTQEKADELIADHIASLAWDDFELLVAAVLRTLGFRTKLSRRGADGGYDIVAHPDALGFEEPRVKVEVKHRKGAMGGPDVRNFRSTIRSGEKGLYVSTGGFKGDAKAELEKAGTPFTLMDQDEFIALLTENYDKLEPEFQALVPLRKVYILAKV